MQETVAIQPSIHVFPALDLSLEKQSAITERISSIKHAKDKLSREKGIFILPLLTKEKYWTAVIIEDTDHATFGRDHLISYLDFAAKSPPVRLANNTSFAELPIVYNTEAVYSGIWLQETLTHFATTKLLIVPVCRIHALVVREEFTHIGLSDAKSDIPNITLEYCGLSAN